MQANLFSIPTVDIHTIRDRLHAASGAIRDPQRLDPVSQFVRSFIGSRTYDHDSWQAFARFTQRFSDWDALAGAPVEEIEALLAGVTHAEKKAPELQNALRKIRVRAGALDLDFLADHPVEQGLRWLEEIHGVGRKIAAATLNFSTLRKRAFVIDTHVLRVLKRFGFVKASAETKDIYDAVMEAVPDFDADDLYELHWYLKRLGQKTCTHASAHCAACPLGDLCMKRMEGGVNRAA
jgi:endonuclease-3